MSIHVSDLYQNLPVKISDSDFEYFTGRNLKEELGATVDEKVQDFLDDVHKNVYYDCIYVSGGKKLKDRIIQKDMEHGGMLEAAIKQCLVTQIKYSFDAGGDYASSDPSSSDTNGNVQIKSNREVHAKILAPGLRDILHSARPDLLMFEEL